LSYRIKGPEPPDTEWLVIDGKGEKEGLIMSRHATKIEAETEIDTLKKKDAQDELIEEYIDDCITHLVDEFGGTRDAARRAIKEWLA
jgi:hypothetical protein